MNKVFLKQDQVNLINGGYLTNGETPIYNEKFVNAQKHAEYVVTFAKMAKEKDFNGKQADSLAEFKVEVLMALQPKNTTYVEAPKEVKLKLTDQLAEEALAFMNYADEADRVEKVNAFLQKFNILKDFEDFGLYFGVPEQPIKLNNLYKIKDVVEAVNSVIDLL